MMRVILPLVLVIGLVALALSMGGKQHNPHDLLGHEVQTND